MIEEKIIRYKGKDLTVTYDVKRCIHAAECVKGLPEVFDPARKPWVDVDRASAADVSAVVAQCPSGALKALHEDGIRETPDATNTVMVDPDGPLYVRGDVIIKSKDGEVVLRDTRLALCRCGASQNKPLCDGSHTRVGFKDVGALSESRLKVLEGIPTEGPLTLTMANNGPLLIEGPVAVFDASRTDSASGTKGALCRCGASLHKPYCDGTHKSIGFVG